MPEPCGTCGGKLLVPTRDNHYERCPRCAIMVDLLAAAGSGPRSVESALKKFEVLEKWAKGKVSLVEGGGFQVDGPAPRRVASVLRRQLEGPVEEPLDEVFEDLFGTPQPPNPADPPDVLDVQPVERPQPDPRQYEAALRAYESGLVGAPTLAELLGIEPPSLDAPRIFPGRCLRCGKEFGSGFQFRDHVCTPTPDVAGRGT